MQDQCIIDKILHKIETPDYFWTWAKDKEQRAARCSCFSDQRLQLPDLLFGKEIPEVFPAGIKVAFDA